MQRGSIVSAREKLIASACEKAIAPANEKAIASVREKVIASVNFRGDWWLMQRGSTVNFHMENSKY